MVLKQLRNIKNQTQSDIAKVINVAPTTYLGYEKGTSEPNIDTLIKLADYFNVSLDYLCDRQWNNQVGYIPEERKAFIQTIIELTDDDFKEIKSYVNGYLAGRTKSEDFNVFD